MAEPAPDLELQRSAVRGDATALQQLLLSHYDRLAMHIGGQLPADPSLGLTAEDVLQECFAEAVRRIGGYDPREGHGFYRWLATIADHRVIDLVRAARADKRGGGRAPLETAETSQVGDLLGLLTAHDHTPSRSVAGHEAVGAIRAALESLSPDHRETIRLRYFEGLSVAQTAERMGRSESAIHMLTHRAVAELRSVMGDMSRFVSRG